MRLPLTWKPPDAAKLLQFYRYEVARHCLGFDEHETTGGVLIADLTDESRDNDERTDHYGGVWSGNGS